MPAGSLTVGAVITDGSGVFHYRDRDHAGFESDENVVLDEDVAEFSEGTELHTVLVELWARATT